MHFSRFDNRAKAETGATLALLDPDTQEPLTHEGNPCAVIVRGVASCAIQQQIRAKARKRMAKKAKANESGETVDAEIACMEDLHENLIDSAAPFIAGFVNVERDGKPLTNSADDVRWFLDLTFPFMETIKDAAGEVVMKDGVPKFEMTKRADRTHEINEAKRVQDMTKAKGP